MFEDDILNGMKHMRNTMNRLFSGSDFPTSLADPHSNYRRALTEFNENEQEYILNIEIPGVNKNDIQVHMNDNTLVIKAEKKQELKKESEDEEGNIKSVSSMKRYVGFYRQFDLPTDADTEQLSADYTDGVLTIKIHKKASKKKTITVK